MSKKKFKLKILIIPIIIIAIIIGALFCTYENYFAPKVPVTSVYTTVNLDPSKLVLDFIPNKTTFSSSKISLSSDGTISDTDLTDIIILVLQNVSNSTMKEITGIQVKIVDNKVNVYATFNYLNIPFEVHFVFTPEVVNGQAVLHYEQGNIGFISLSKNMVFKHLSDKSFMTIDSENGNINLIFNNSNKIKINTFTTDGSSLKIGFTIPISFDQALANKIISIPFI